jgi:hypothetical protein
MNYILSVTFVGGDVNCKNRLVMSGGTFKYSALGDRTCKSTVEYAVHSHTENFHFSSLYEKFRRKFRVGFTGVSLSFEIKNV